MSAPPPIKSLAVMRRIPEDGEMTPLPAGFWRNPETGMGRSFPPPPKGPLKRQVASSAKPVLGWPNIDELIDEALSPQQIKAILDKAIADADKKEK